MKVLGVIDKIIEKVAAKILIFAVFVMLGLSTLSIVLRWLERSLLWIDPLVRHLVFLSAFLGGILATGKGSHIGIDILGKVLETRKNFAAQRLVGLIVNLASFLILLWLAYASYDFMVVELKYGKPAFLGIHSGFLVGIIPVSFLLISYRFFYRFLQALVGEKQVGEA